MIVHPRRRLWSLAACIAVGLAISGCFGGDELPRQPLSGLVKLNGQPLVKGRIILFPVGPTIPGNAVEGAALIRNGRFSIRRAHGLIPGKYRIGIYSADMREARRQSEMSPGKGETRIQDVIPAKFNSQSKLEFDITDAPIKELMVDLR